MYGSFNLMLNSLSLTASLLVCGRAPPSAPWAWTRWAEHSAPPNHHSPGFSRMVQSSNHHQLNRYQTINQTVYYCCAPPTQHSI